MENLFKNKYRIKSIRLKHYDYSSDGAYYVTICTKNHNPMLSKSLSTIIRWFKGRSTYEINKMQDYIHFQWQSRFYEHIIRNERELNSKRQYIVNNPMK